MDKNKIVFIVKTFWRWLVYVPLGIITAYDIYRLEINTSLPPLIALLPNWHWSVWLSILLFTIILDLSWQLIKRDHKSEKVQSGDSTIQNTSASIVAGINNAPITQIGGLHARKIINNGVIDNGSDSSTAKPSNVRLIINEKFKNQTIQLDNIHYKDCFFTDCTFRWAGNAFIMDNVRVDGFRGFESSDRNIVITIDLLKMFGFLTTEFSDSWNHKSQDYFK